MRYITVKYSNEDACYIASTPAFPSIKTHGYTEEDAEEEMRILLDILDNYPHEDKEKND